MSEQAAASGGPRVLAAGAGEITGPEDGARDRYMIDATDSGGRVAVVEHLLAPRVLAGPVHLHTREDEFSYVLEGHVGAMLGNDEVVAGPGDLIFKPREQWHTFWNAGDTPARILEIISPAGLEELFRQFGDAGYPEPEALAEMAAAFGARLDFEATMPLVQKHGLQF
jgi:mannose-6-phosphate isomerase-like protein (cupin superfamily)